MVQTPSEIVENLNGHQTVAIAVMAKAMKTIVPKSDGSMMLEEYFAAQIRAALLALAEVELPHRAAYECGEFIRTDKSEISFTTLAENVFRAMLRAIANTVDAPGQR